MNKKATGAVSVPERPKSLANCDLTEFLGQLNKIRKSVEKWLTVTDIMKIRSRRAALLEIPAGATADERAEIENKNREISAEQAKNNISAMLDAMLEEHLNETVEVLALCSFIDPADAGKYPVTMYLRVVNDLLNNQDVIDFFTSLMRVDRMSGVTA